MIYTFDFIFHASPVFGSYSSQLSANGKSLAQGARIWLGFLSIRYFAQFRIVHIYGYDVVKNYALI